MKYSPKIKKLLTNKFFVNSFWYTFATMLPPLTGIILLPVFTKYFTPGEYGIFTTVQSYVWILQLLMILSLHGAITRLYYDYKENSKEQKEYLGSVVMFTVVFAGLISALLLLLKPIVGPLLFKNIPIDPYYDILIYFALSSSLSLVPMAILRAQERAKSFVVINIIKSVIVMAVTSIAVIFMNKGPEAALFSFIIAGIGTGLGYIGVLYKSVRLSFKKEYIKQSLAFSIPLLPHVISGWAITASSRFILEKFVSLDELGRFSLAAQMAMVLGMLYTGVNNAFVPRYTRLMKDAKENEANKIMKYFQVGVIVLGVLAIIFSLLVIEWLLPPKYNGVSGILIFLLTAEIVRGFYFVVVARLFYIKNTKIVGISSVSAATVNVGVNLILIPIIGVWGAVVAAIAAELTRFIFNLYQERRYLNKKLQAESQE
ncbi:lipopolysaccharide biosynthesis protein [Fictibacillus phosphorivorans]|uniref:lipopolysaccharide biosynthesis protein n=1 Tax=Fictibacillus phosphorivorans TaxID=1221500 RepID=UPI0011A6887A|nr:oligosaccharide flippase family protein [Fictibacillus phosphorivorans]